ncbi:MAG: hypothetical protein KGL95_16025, partial [Patescibacteria group bacterium]|nr:hypothetical protein [Patescibacteria group bacterium]
KKYVAKIAKYKINTANTFKLGEICFVSYGLRLNSDKYDKDFKFKKEDLLSEARTQLNNRIYTEGKYLEEYVITRELYVEWGSDRCPKRLVRATFPELYDQPKLLMSRQKGIVAFSDQNHVCDNTIIVGVLAKDLATVDNSNIRKYYGNLKVNRKQIEDNSRNFDLKYLLALLNSALIRYFIKYNSEGKFDTYPDDWKKIPIKKISLEEQTSYAIEADSLLSLNKEFFSQKARFLVIISNEFNITLTAKLNNFTELTFESFTQEIEKISKVSLSLTKKDEMLDYFDKYKNSLLLLKSQIQSVQKRLDDRIFRLYDVDENSQNIVEFDLNTDSKKAK